MPELNSSKRAQLPNSAFAYIDSRGQRRLPINDEGHVRNALARFNQVKFEDEEARERARKRLLNAARKYKIVPVGFITGQIQSEREFGQSQRRNIELPTGLITLMMTDIEGSTTLVNQLGKDYGKLIREIRTIIRKVVAGQAGHVVDVKADEAFAVFKRSSDAIASAVGIQREIGERPSTRTHDVRIRIGLHSGKPTISDSNYIGIAVHTAARICSAAHGGQIVLSAQTREALKDPTPDGLGFRSLGSHRLRGLPEPVALYQVSAEGLAVKFPRLKIDSK
jgi:class 3 adenylate cyclase